MIESIAGISLLGVFATVVGLEFIDKYRVVKGESVYYVQYRHFLIWKTLMVGDSTGGIAKTFFTKSDAEQEIRKIIWLQTSENKKPKKAKNVYKYDRYGREKK